MMNDNLYSFFILNSRSVIAIKLKLLLNIFYLPIYINDVSIINVIFFH